MNKQVHDGEINLEKLYRIIVNSKWLILFITLISFLFTYSILYFKPSIYSSSAILEIKSKTNRASSNDFLLNAFSMGSGAQIDKEIEILQTFSINNEALKKVDFKIRYYKNKNYKNIEIYKNIPLSIHDIIVFDDEIIGKELIIYPQGKKFKIEVKKSLKSKILKLFSIEPLVQLDGELLYSYNKKITNSYLQFTVNKELNITEPISFIIYGNNRKIYDTVISQNLEVKQINPNAPLIEISYLDNIPTRANNYVNALANSFINQSTVAKNEQNSRILTFIDEQLASIKGRLKASENRLESYKVANKVVEPSVEASTYIEKLANIEIELSESLLKEKLVSNLISFARHNNNLDSIAPALMELKDQPTLQLITSLQGLELKKEDLSIEFTNQHPQIIAIEKQMYNIREKILLNIRNLKANIRQRTDTFKKEKKSYENKIKTLPTKEKKLVNIKRDYHVSSTMYNYLLKKKTENEILMVSTLSDYKIIDYAHISNAPIKPKRSLILMASLFIGLLIGSLLAVILQGMNRKINSKESLESLTDLPLYGIIPTLKGKKVKLEVLVNPNSHFTESLRSLRSNLQINKNPTKGNIILLTSTIAEEGKSMLTANLGAIFQMAGYKTLMINLDLRKPTLHNYFNIKNGKGMSGFLSSKDSIQEIIFSTEHKGLHLIPSGIIPLNPSELILSDRLPKLLDILKTRYDYIFIDSAPIGLVSDTIHIMKYTDMNLIIFRESYADKSFIEGVHNIIEKNKIKSVGMILNRSHSKNTIAYGYGYGYGEKQ
jgi:capsular exopolysaccharide synthesis family protein